MNSKIKLSFRYFNIRNFEIPKYWSFYIPSFQILTPTRILTIKNLVSNNTLTSYKKYEKSTETIHASPHIVRRQKTWRQSILPVSKISSFDYRFHLRLIPKLCNTIKHITPILIVPTSLHLLILLFP